MKPTTSKLMRTWTLAIAVLLTALDARGQGWVPIPAEPDPPTDPTQIFKNVTCKWNQSAIYTTRCLVSVRPYDVSSTECKVDAPNITLEKPNRKYIIIWRPTDQSGTPLPDEYRFCPLTGDGVELKDLDGSNDEQFDDKWSGDVLELGNDSSGQLGKSCFRRSRILAINSKSGQPKYNYEIRLHHFNAQTSLPIGKACKADPFIKNG